MSTERINNDISPDVLETAKLLQTLIQREVKRQLAETHHAPASPSEKIDTPTAARILGVKPRTVYAYIDSGKLTPERTGPKKGKLMFYRADVERLAQG